MGSNVCQSFCRSVCLWKNVCGKKVCRKYSGKQWRTLINNIYQTAARPTNVDTPYILPHLDPADQLDWIQPSNNWSVGGHGSSSNNNCPYEALSVLSFLYNHVHSILSSSNSSHGRNFVYLLNVIDKS